MPVHVVFVCMGNICRSPMAEAVFQQMVQEAGLDDQVVVDSCGTGGWHAGEQPHPGTRAVLDKHRIPYHHHARQITRDDLTQAGFLIAMDNDNLSEIRRMGSTNAEVALLLDYAPDASVREVPDPYYSDRFDEVYDLVRAGCLGLLAHIRQEENL